MFISSSRRATAGVRVPIDRGLGPLFGLNAVWAIGTAGCLLVAEGVEEVGADTFCATIVPVG